jgi:hypothetical protein
MKAKLTICAVAAVLAAITTVHAQASAQPAADGTVPVTADNFVRAETDLYFVAVVKKDGLGKFERQETFAGIRPTLDQLLDKALGIPGVSAMIKPAVDVIRSKLDALATG